ncbi:DEAD/DEAH box helicase family protein [Eubacteriales bacterium OttesenSCG-928-A19]|nr:DEAD/DEAH box helicase family protein [Eubacteriales bacterium OttesenSCG-928-A19]
MAGEPITEPSFAKIRELEAERDRLLMENQRLRELLDTHGIVDHEAITESEITDSVQPKEETADTEVIEGINKYSPSEDKIALFLSLFRGREDVYARQWQSRDGKIGYSPACKNEWVPGICGKPKAKCASCPHAMYYPYDNIIVNRHLRGECVAGIYPLLENDTCHFLAIDFDEASWRKDVRIVAEACEKNAIPHAIEVSRSGNGAHLWFFLELPLPAAQARSFGTQILTLAMQEHAKLHFSSYDRMFPNQDTMPKGGFGNLIALPLQKRAREKGGSVFVDKRFEPYEDQWAFLSSILRITKAQVEAYASAWRVSPLGSLRVDEQGEEGKPWKRANTTPLSKDDCPPVLNAVMADMLYIPLDGFTERAKNQMQRLAAFRNPQFYQAQAMRMPVWNKPRVICCAEYRNDYLCLPRGCLEDFTSFAQENNMQIIWQDERDVGKSIDVDFVGTLRDEQQPALDALLTHDNGILSATTAFGKTVLGAALIAARRVNTLVLVHRKQLLLQWQERLGEFLEIHEVLPEQPKKRGRKRQRDVIGLFGAAKDTRSGIVDIAILQSMGSADEIKPWIGEYGMVIVDECHHIPAISFEQVLKSVRARYVYGLTATPTRQDGHHPILYMHLGGIRYQVDAKAQAEKRPFAHVMIPRFTGSRFHVDGESRTPAIGQYYAQIMEDDLRNHQIVDDVLACAKEGRHCLLLSERTDHVKTLAALLRAKYQDVLILTGGKSSAETQKQMDALHAIPADQPLVICATGKYIGEGFDESRLDTLFLTMPISWKGTLAQYAGRLHRLHDGKREVRVYDYVDTSVEMLERMYHKRLKGYAAIGYQVSADRETVGINGDVIYDQNTFVEAFLKDLDSAKDSIVIVSPYVTVKRVRWLEDILIQKCRGGLSVMVYTRPAESFQGKSMQAVRMAIDALERIGVRVNCLEGIHQKHAVIDDRIVWYGSINLLSFGASQESIMRLNSGSVARALKME